MLAEIYTKRAAVSKTAFDLTRRVGMKMPSRMPPSFFRIRLLLSIFAVFTFLKAEGVEAGRPNILFCIADDWGWPHAGAYGDAVVKTPAFDRIAGEGVLFRNAFVSAPSCTPSRNAILTGQWHWRLGPGANLWSTLPQGLKVYPHVLRESGYHIGSWRKSWGPGKLDGKWADDPPAGKVFPKGFGQFLESVPKSTPFCFWLGAFDPHRPYREGSGRESGMDLSKIALFPHLPDDEIVRSDVADYYFEVQRFDADVGAALELLEKRGELDNTIIVMTGDHGMPFPRCKADVYDSGARVPLALRWGAKVKPGQVLDGFVSTTDLAPTFLNAAGLPASAEMTGRSLLAAITGGGDARLRPHVLIGKERHVPAQEAPNMGGYPIRAIRTKEFLFIRNYEPNRWPNGTPNWQQAWRPGAWLADIGNCPTKTYMVANKDKDEIHRAAYERAFTKRPGIELYDLKGDAAQLRNVAADPAYAGVVRRLGDQLDAELRASLDPRHGGPAFDFDSVPYLGGYEFHPDFKAKNAPPK